MIIVGRNQPAPQAGETGDIIYLAIFESLKISGQSFPTVGSKYIVIFDDLKQKQDSVRNLSKLLLPQSIAVQI